MYHFEFDSKKSISNYRKHGIDFVEAQKLWNDSDFLELPGEPYKKIREIRFLIIGCIGEKYWTAIITYRGDNIRIISVRRSRRSEIKAYENSSRRVRQII